MHQPAVPPTGTPGGAWGRAPAWMGWAAALTSGLGLVVAFPAPDLGWVAWFALVPLLLVTTTARGGRAAALGYVAGLVFFGGHMAWIAELGADRAAGRLAWIALSALQAGVFAAFFGLVPASRRLGAWRYVTLPAWWATLELLRAHVPFGGNAWGLLGVTQHSGGPMLEAARVLGVYGVGAVIVAVNLALTQAIRHLLPTLGRGHARRWRPAAGWTVLAVGLVAAGLAAPPAPPGDGEPFRIAAIQGNARFSENRGASTRAVFQRHLQRTYALADLERPVDLVVWPEGAANADPLTHPEVLAAIQDAAAAVDAPILLGATTELGERYRTEALLFAPPQPGAPVELADRYAKRRLLPFGEFIPLGSVMRTLVPATRQLPYDKVPGTRLEPMTVGGQTFGVIICYESAYPEDTRTLTQDGARFVVLITNNASFGRSWLASQHLAASQLRAVESGRDVLHAAISGISGVINATGTVGQTTGLYTQATILTQLQPRTGLTPYVRFGQQLETSLAALGTGMVLLLGLSGWRQRRRGAPPPTPDTTATTVTPAPAGRATRGEGER